MTTFTDIIHRWFFVSPILTQSAFTTLLMGPTHSPRTAADPKDGKSSSCSTVGTVVAKKKKMDCGWGFQKQNPISTKTTTTQDTERDPHDTTYVMCRHIEITRDVRNEFL